MMNKTDWQGSTRIAARLFVLGYFAACTALISLVTPPLAAQNGNSQKLKIQVIYLGHGGCQPAEIHHTGGNFQLYVVNLSQIRDLQLVLHPENGANLSNKNVKDKDHDWLQSVNLPPGRYVLEATNSPEHHCSVVIE